MGEITNYSVTNGEAIVEIPVSVEEDIDQVENVLTDHFQSIQTNYYLFISTPSCWYQFNQSR